DGGHRREFSLNLRVVILSEVAHSRSEYATQSKDPYERYGCATRPRTKHVLSALPTNGIPKNV
ncbi:MAG: hypothetical protein WB562_08955, partial [Candidatus Sulfotelmatobacter sp.]